MGTECDCPWGADNQSKPVSELMELTPHGDPAQIVRLPDANPTWVPEQAAADPRPYCGRQGRSVGKLEAQRPQRARRRCSRSRSHCSQGGHERQRRAAREVQRRGERDEHQQLSC